MRTRLFPPERRAVRRPEPRTWRPPGSPRSLRPRRPLRLRRPVRLWARTPGAYWGAVAVMAVVTAAAIDSREHEIRQRHEAVGPTVEVLVANRDLPAGRPVSGDDLESIQVPRRLVPDGAIRQVPGPGTRLTVAVGRREILTRHRLVGGAPSSLAAAIPPGWRGIAIPADGVTPDLVRGDRIDLVGLGSDGQSVPIVTDAVVLARSGATATVAVPRRAVGAVADAVLAATLGVSLVGR